MASTVTLHWSHDLPPSPCALSRSGELIFVASHTASGDQSALHALAPEGRELWSRIFERTIVSGLETSRVSKTREVSKVFIALSSADLLRGEAILLALKEDGQEAWRWTHSVQKVSAPAVVDDLIYFTADGKTLLCLDTETGKEDQRWSLPVAASSAAPLIMNDVAYIACRGPQVLAYHFDGRVLWQHTHEDSAAWLDQTPVAIGNVVVVASSRGEALALDRRDGTVQWRVAIGAGHTALSVPATDGQRVYAGAYDGVYALDPKGGRVLWSFRTDRRIEAMPLVVNDVVYAAGHDHRLYALEASTGRELWRWAAAQRIETSPLVLPDQALIVVADHAGHVTAVRRPLTADELAQAGRWAEAAEAYAAAGQLVRQAEAWAEYARQLQGRGEAEQAGSIWEQAAQLFTQLEQLERAQACQREVLRCWQLPVLAVEIQARDLHVDEWSAVDLTVRNEGYGPAHNIIIRAEGDQFAGRVMETQRIATLNVGRTQTDQLDVKPREAGRVPLRLRFEYVDRRGAAHSLKHTLYVDVARPAIWMRDVPIGSEQTDRSGDVVGRDQIIIEADRVIIGGISLPRQMDEKGPLKPPEPAAAPGSRPALEVQTLRVDAAVPEQVFVDRVFDLAVAVRQMASPLLAVKDLTHVESGEVQTTWDAGAPLINLRVEVDAPDCEIVGKGSIPFRLVRGKDAPPIYFHLKPLRVGELSIVVTVYQEDYWLGSARVNTIAAEQAAQPAGQVQLTVASQPLWLDCELRIFDPIDQRYHVELTLNGEQTFGGMASADLAAWVATGDPAADGPALFKAALAGDELLKAWGEARGRSKQRRLRLRLDPPELHALPWELLRDGDELIAADADTPFSRYLAIGKEWGRALADRPIRVLAAISNPIDLGAKYGLPPADVELEARTLKAAFDPHPGPLPGRERETRVPFSLAGRRGGAEGASLTFLTPPITLDRLEAELRNGYHVLHFIGHGAFNVKEHQAALYFENNDRTACRVIDADFAGMLDRLQAPPQLVVLAACQSAQQSLRDVFTGLGPRLVQIGVPAVVAMHADVTMLTARQFAATFYRRLLMHGTVDLAMNEARSTLITNGRYDAAVPVLFMRLRDGRLWSEAPRMAATTPPPSTPIEPPRPIGRAPLSKEERDSLERQLQAARENLRLIEERKAEYVLGVEVPLQLVKEERRLRDRIAELEAKLRR